MRVITGTAKGTALFPIAGSNIRPTGDRVKEALFNIIKDDVFGKKVLDLFAGTGALGIEALSRGASFAVFTDNSGEAVNTINKNLAKTGLVSKAKVVNTESLSYIKASNMKFDIVFIDPPYKSNYIYEALENIAKHDILEKDGFIVAESDDEGLMPDDVFCLKLYDKRKYGRTFLNFYKISID